MPNKMLKIVAPFQYKASESEDDTSITIKGYASTNDKDRQGDVILSTAWKGGLKDYKNNPVILAFHNHEKPIGIATEIAIDNKGLSVTARITKAAGMVYDLIKEGVLQTFSVGFIPKDGDYDKDTDIFVIKQAELYEISVVSVPANAAAGFSVAKNFKDESEYNVFKKEFEKPISEEKLMPKEIDTTEEKSAPVDLKALAAQISAQVKADLEKDAETKAAADAKRKEEDDRITVTATTAAERILKEAEDRLLGKDEEVAETLKTLAEALKESKEEVEELRNFQKSNKMTFVDGNGKRTITDDEKDSAVLLAKCLRKNITDTKYFKELIEKSGEEHFDTDAATGEWESTWNTRVENAMREQLVVEPVFQSFPMPTPTYNFPINPEAGQAYWIPTSDFRGADSTGTAVDHQLSDHSITAEKLAAKEYIGYEEEEDSIIPLLPIIRDAIARRMALESDRAILLGEGAANTAATSSPILGLDGLSGVTDVSVISGGALTDEDIIVNARRDLGIYGLDPSKLVLFISHEWYYSLMKLDNFKTVDVAGDSRATLFKGQLGSIWGIPVIVSQQFDTAGVAAGTVGTVGAILVRPDNFLVGNLRGTMTETDRDIEQQKNILVTSRRFGFTDIIDGVGTVSLVVAT